MPYKYLSQEWADAGRELAQEFPERPGATARLSVRQDQSEVVVTVRDDGPGSDTLNSPDALPGLRDRMDALGGTLTVHSHRHGTTVTGKIPCI